MVVIDNNRIPASHAVSNADGETLIQIQADPITHSLAVSDGISGTDKSGDTSPRNEDRQIAFMAVSSADGVTPVPVYIDATTKSLLLTSI